MLLAELVAAAEEVAATRSRTEKIERLAAVLSGLAPDEIEPATGFLAGNARQGKIGVGWSTLARTQVPPAAHPTLTITDTDEMLSLVQATTGKGSDDRRGMILSEFLQRATDAEASFLHRLLVGELRQGALEGIAVEAIAKAAGVPAAAVRRALMLGGDVRVTARIALTKGEAGLNAVRLEVLRPVQPMLASTAPSLEEATNDGGVSVEWKLDGIRIQVHRAGDVVRVFTRNLNDITDRVPGVVAAARMLSADTAVLDGEAIVFSESDRPVLFQDARTYESMMTPAFFDILHADGRDLMDLPLSERQSMLASVAGAFRIQTMPSGGDAASFLESALAAGHEGVMVKRLDSTYQAGRRGSAWLKVKPAPTLDLVILAAEWGHGRRTGSLSNLHLGARNPDGSFVMVGKTFKGLTDAMLAWQTQRLLSLETHRDAYTVYVRPELVVEIAVDSAQRSKRYPGGVALRFARVKRYREDKRADQADVIDAVRALVPGYA